MKDLRMNTGIHRMYDGEDERIGFSLGIA